MRMSGFLIGGMLGAAAALYFTKNKSMMMANVNWDQAVDKAGQFVKGAKSMWDTASIISATGSGSGSKGAGGLDKVEEIVRKDPELTHKVDEIMKESGQSNTTYQ